MQRLLLCARSACAAAPSASLQPAAGRPAQAHASPHVEHAELLERWLMEGAYNKVLAARDDMPDPAYAYFMQRLLTTVRCGPAPRASSPRLPRMCLKPAGCWPARGTLPSRFC